MISGEHHCLVCNGRDLSELAVLPEVPALCNELLFDAQTARAVPRGRLHLMGCRTCGHMFNAAFDASVLNYNAAYENSLLCSAGYRAYTNQVVDRLATVCGPAPGRVVEIGCGRAEFLQMLCRRGFRSGVGFDPGRPDERIVEGDAEISVVGTAFDPHRAPDADLVCSRHVLEHLPNPVDLLRGVSEAYCKNPPRSIFIEVPDGSFTLVRLGIWDLIYEHVSYFTTSSLWYALARAGLRPVHLKSVFGNQFLAADAEIAGDRPIELPRVETDLLAALATFESQFARMQAAWGQWLRDAFNQGRKVVLWGAGSKGVMFLNLLDRGTEDRTIRYVIDMNPLKHGAFVAGTGHPVRPPAVVRDDRPDAILLMNPQYEGEVRQVLSEFDPSIEIVNVSGEFPPHDCRNGIEIPPGL